MGKLLGLKPVIQPHEGGRRRLLPENGSAAHHSGPIPALRITGIVCLKGTPRGAYSNNSEKE
jgi:hypothetical protein